VQIIRRSFLQAIMANKVVFVNLRAGRLKISVAFALHTARANIGLYCRRDCTAGLDLAEWGKGWIVRHILWFSVSRLGRAIWPSRYSIVEPVEKGRSEIVARKTTSVFGV